MPERSRIFWAEDYIPFRKAASELVAGEGHVIVETASSLKEAMEKIPGLAKKKG